MGQIASIFDPDERREDEELEYIDEEDEYNRSLSRTPMENEEEEYEEEDDSEFTDCVGCVFRH